MGVSLIWIVTALGQNAPGAVVASEFLFDVKPTPSCHASTIVETPSGLVAAWFGGKHEGHPEVGIWLTRQVGGKWTTPVEVFNGRDGKGGTRACYNPVLFQPPGKPLVLFFKVGTSPRTWEGLMATSIDDGKTWGPAKTLPKGIVGPVRNKPILMPDGAWLCGSSFEHEGRNWKCFIDRTADNGATWTQIGPLNAGPTFRAIQPTLFRFDANRLLALCRTGEKVVGQSWSADDGKSWTEMAATPLPNPNAAVDGVMLNDGRALLIHNDSPKRRSPLVASVSWDGKTWQAAATLEDGKGEYDYPAVIQTADGKVHVTYTHQRLFIKHLTLDPNKLNAAK